ncbi:hypothetical protein C6A37_01635 [Desulfobacteraceae bacterium SEEP-SAG9]|nr:hypothetical protein C6A37_01635 [Desulfobacteraceae bacterium SEEP-SAG9]
MFSDFYHNNKSLKIIICFAILLRLIFFLTVNPWNDHILKDKIIVNDALQYHNLALEILEDLSFSSTIRTPGYPSFIAMIYLIFGVRPWVVLFIQLLLNIFSLIMVYLLSKMFFNNKISIIATFLYAIDPHVIFYSTTLLTDTLFVFLFLSSILSLIQGLSNQKALFLFLTGFFLGLATLVRPISQYFIFIVLLIVLFYPDIKWSFRLKAIPCFLFIFILTISPWMFRNYSQYGRLSLTSMQGSTLLFWYATYVEVSKTSKTKEQVRTEFKNIAEEKGINNIDNQFAKSDIYNKIAIDYLSENINTYVIYHIKGNLKMFANLNTKNICDFLRLKNTKLDYEYSATSFSNLIANFLKVKTMHEIAVGILIIFFLLITYSSFIIGAISMISKKESLFLFLTLLIIFYFLSLTGIMGDARYKLPIEPFILIISANGISNILNTSSMRKVISFNGDITRIQCDK